MKIKFWSGLFLVVANVMGTGVFSTIGVQSILTPHMIPIMLAWIIGGLMSVFGAISYVGLSRMIPGSGGEYLYISKIYGRPLGFLAGWAIATVAFVGPLAVAAQMMGTYLNQLFPQISELTFACLSVIAVTFVHFHNNHVSSSFHNFFTVTKLILFAVLIYFAFTNGKPTHLEFSHLQDQSFTMSSFFISLIIVMYAYCGWNAIVFMIDDIENPEKNLNKILVIGVSLVSILYVLFQLAVLHVFPLESLKGVPEVAHLLIESIWSDWGKVFIYCILILCLIPSMSAFVWTNPQVIRSMSKDFRVFHRFTLIPSDKPLRLILVLQTLLTLGLILSSAVGELIKYLGFTLNLFSFLTILGIFIIHIKDKKRPLISGYPWTTGFFLIFSFLMGVFSFWEEPRASFLGLLNLVIGYILYVFSEKKLT
jgi:APA family basic amino acid/polyamine antiporter